MKELEVLMEVPGAIDMKFALMMLAVEYLGMLEDRQHSKTTARSEIRFNMAIRKHFPTAYHHFTRAESIPNLFRDLRCPLIHRFETVPGILLHSRRQIPGSACTHLKYNEKGDLVLIAEDFFTDLKNAANQLIS
jgi:hypothetical protein